MAQKAQNKPVAKTILLGLASVGLYAAVFTNSGEMMTYCTKGGAWTALPIATVFAVSFVHGGFASNLWTCLGITARKSAPRPEAVKRPAMDTRPRVSAQQA
jgi:hypothetical protein